jgi:hypothetical protein
MHFETPFLTSLRHIHLSLPYTSNTSKWTSLQDFRLKFYLHFPLIPCLLYVQPISSSLISLPSSIWRRSHWARGCRHEMSSPAQILGSWVRIPLETWMCAFRLCFYCPLKVAAFRRADHPSKESYRLCIYLSIYLWLYSSLLDIGHIFSFLIFYTVGRTAWTGDQPVARPLPAHRTAETKNKRTETSMSQVRFESTIQCSREGTQFMPHTARPQWSAPTVYKVHKFGSNSGWEQAREPNP